MNKTQDKFSLPAVTLSIFAAAAAERLPVCSSSRALLWQEVLAAVLLMILSALVSRFWQSGPPKPAAWAAAFCLQVWLAVELAEEAGLGVAELEFVEDVEEADAPADVGDEAGDEDHVGEAQHHPLRRGVRCLHVHVAFCLSAERSSAACPAAGTESTTKPHRI